MLNELIRWQLKQTTYIVVDFNDLVSVPVIEEKFRESPDEILVAFRDAIYEMLKERYPEYAEKTNMTYVHVQQTFQTNEVYARLTLT